MGNAYNSAWWLQWVLRRLVYAFFFVIVVTALFTTVAGSRNWWLGALAGIVAALIIGALTARARLQAHLKRIAIINHPLDRVFKLMAEDFFATTAKWYAAQNPEAHIQLAEHDTPMSQGARGRILAKLDDDEYEWRFVIVSYKPQSEIAFRVTQSGIFDRETEYYRFTPTAGGTKIELLRDLKPGLKAGLTSYNWLPQWRLEYAPESARFLALVERELDRLA